ncbi:MAG: NHL repeat-containing protein [Gallionellaceae bacterium]|nr:MAG: NHL repeat-containing protein [Gallionellaceae bacterium]
MTVRNGFAATRILWLGVTLAALMLAGCASKAERGVLNYGLGASPELVRMTWPPRESGEVPRYVYAGELTGEENFRVPQEKKTGASGFFSWLAGLFDFEAVPVVLQRPQAGAVDGEGRVFVTDASRQAVFVFDPVEGRLDVWEGAAASRHFVAPTGIALGEMGEIYVADSELGFVARINREGKNVGVIGEGELSRPVGVAFDAVTRQLYVADTHAHDIKVFDASGRLLRTLGKHGDKPGEFNFPTYLALVKGELVVADTMNARVQLLDIVTGQTRLIIGERGLNVGNLVRPKGVAADDEGNIYVVESYFDHLLVFNRKGEFLMPIGGVGREVGKFYLPSSVWIDARNRVFVADMFNGRVSLFQFLGGGAESE